MSNFKTRDIAKATINIIVMLLFVATVFCLSACSNPTQENASTTTQSPNAGVGTEITPTPAPSKNTNSQAVYMGEKCETKNELVIIVNSVESKTSIANDYIATETENQYAIVNFTIQNNSSKEFDFFADNFTLVKDGAMFSYDMTATLYLDGGTVIEAINPSLTKKFKVVYEIPKDLNVKEFIFEYKENMFLKTKYDMYLIAR